MPTYTPSSFMDPTPDNSHAAGHPFLLSAPPPQHHYQHQQHMTIPVTISENPWEDWTSIASSATLLDDNASFLAADAAVQWAGSSAAQPGQGLGVDTVMG